MFNGTQAFGAVKAWALAAATALSFPVAIAASDVAEAKTPGKTYCFNRVCHRVKTLAETTALIGKDLKFKTSFYDDCKRDRYNPCGLTSSGEVFRPAAPDNAASPIYPNGTVLLLRNPSNGQAVIVRVNNAGPYWGNRKLDVSRGVAEKLGFKRRGVADLEVRVVYAPTKAEARYKKRRNYARVPGPIGRFASLADAGSFTMIALNQVTFDPTLKIAALDRPAKKLASVAAGERPAAEMWRVASADQLPSLVKNGDDAATISPAEALKAEAIRETGEALDIRLTAPATLSAEAASSRRERERPLATQ